MYADTSSDKARFQPKISAAGFVCSAVFWYSITPECVKIKTASNHFFELSIYNL